MTTSAPGLLRGRPHALKRAADDLPTWYVSRQGHEGGGRSPDRPTTLARVQRLLDDPGRTFTEGLRVLFQRGETWTLADAAPPRRAPRRAGRAGRPGRRSPADRRPPILLTITASGVADAPIVLGAYGDGPLPRFYGDGDFTDAGPVRPRSQGIRVEGACWVQLEQLNVANFQVGIYLTSDLGQRDRPSPEAPMRGCRDLVLADLLVEENWEHGVSIHSRFDQATRRVMRTQQTPLLLVGDGTLVGAAEGRRVAVPVDPAGWWPERIAVENCRLEGNGEGSRSSGVNLAIGGLASKIHVRHCRLIGREHSRGWLSQPGCYAAGVEPLPPGAKLNEAVWRQPGSERLWRTWGVDGITATNGGCDIVIERCVLAHHVHGQSGVPPFSCGRDDGNGVDLKNVGNRQYWEDDGAGGRRLSRLPNVIRHNAITDNAAPGLVLHFGCRDLQVHDNLFAYNRGTDGAAIRVQAGPSGNGLYAGEHDGEEKGPALVSGLYIFRNRIVRNGQLRTPKGPVSAAEGVGGNAVTLVGSRLWHGSFEGVWFVNNTVAHNKRFGLCVRMSDGKTKDRGQWRCEGVTVAGNVFAGNSGPEGVQVRVVDTLPRERGGETLMLGENGWDRDGVVASVRGEALTAAALGGPRRVRFADADKDDFAVVGAAIGADNEDFSPGIAVV